MNAVYKLIFNISSGTWAVAHEFATGRSRKGRTRLAVALAAALVLPSGAALAADPSVQCAADEQVSADGLRCEASSGGSVSSSGVGILSPVAVLERAVAIGGAVAVNATATGFNSIAIGDGAEALANDNLAVGSQVRNQAANSFLLANNYVQVDAASTGSFVVANRGGTSGAYATPVVGSADAVAILGTANNATRGVAVGHGSSVTAADAVALGSGSVATETNTVSIGTTAAGGQRRLVNLAAGTVDTDAVNVGQLKGTAKSVADAFGGGSVVNADGTISAPTYTLDDGTGTGGTVDVTNLGDALGNLDGRTTANTGDITNLTSVVNNIAAGGAGMVTYDAASGTVNVAASQGGLQVDFRNASGDARVLGGVDAGVADDDAANVGQLKGTAQSVADAFGGGSVVNADGTISAPTYTLDDGTGTGGTIDVTNLGDALTNLDGRTTNNTSEISNLNTVVNNLSNGSLGLVQQSVPGADLTVGAGTDGDRVDFDGTGGARRLGGVANGVDDHDAVTLAQLKAAGLYDPTTGTALSALVYDDASLDRATLGGLNGTVIANLGNGLIAAGSMEAVNGGQLWQMNNDWEAKWSAIDGRVGTIEQDIANGNIGGPGGSGGPVIAPGAGQGSVAVGDGADAVGNGSVAIGEGSSAAADGSIAIGEGAAATGNDSVAIGSGSTADRDNEFSVGSDGNERVIGNVAAGTRPTDAVNLQQMEDRFQSERDWANGRFQAVDKRIDRMGAISAAYAGMAMNVSGPGPDRRFGAGVGSQNGRTALAVGFQRVFGEQKQVSFSIGGAFSGSDQSVSTGAGIKW